jgi:hypothetical protein
MQFGPNIRMFRARSIAGPTNRLNASTHSLGRLATALVLLITLLCTFQINSDACLRQEAIQPQKETKPPQRIVLKAVRVSNGQTPDGIWYSATKFEAPDGSVAYNLVIPFESISRAEEELRTRVKLARKIVRHDPQIDKDGRTVGQRVLALYPGSTADISIIKLSWTIGSTYFEINSKSMANVLELERQDDVVSANHDPKK